MILTILIVFIFPEHVMHSIENINLTQIPSLEEIKLRDKDAAVVCSKSLFYISYIHYFDIYTFVRLIVNIYIYNYIKLFCLIF